MIDLATQRILVDLLQRESRSLLMYVSEAFPWATPEEHAVLSEIVKMVKEEEQNVVRLARFMQRHRLTIPPLGAYPMSFTTINFVSLDYIVPLLIARQKQRIGEITAQLAQVSDEHARKHIQEIIDAKTRHSKILENIRSKPAAA